MRRCGSGSRRLCGTLGEAIGTAAIAAVEPLDEESVSRCTNRHYFDRRRWM
jgi:hypothetical protein